jgi:chromosome partitioning protein
VNSSLRDIVPSTMGKIIAIGNLKGGVGKTTLAVNAACQMAEERRQIVLVDADTQASASGWAATGVLPIACKPLPLDTDRQAAKWIAAVRQVAADADFAVIDLPPHIGAVMASAMIVADKLVLPVGASALDLRAAGKTLDLLREAQRERGDGLPSCLLVPARVDRRRTAGRVR